MLKHNPRWAAKLAKQAERQKLRKEREEAKKRAEEEAEARRLAQERTTNPFKMSAGSGASFLGQSLFSPPQTVPTSSQTPSSNAEAMDELDYDEDEDDDDFDDEERLAEELAIKASIEELQAQLQDDWTRTSSYYTTSLYLNTIPEPRPAQDTETATELASTREASTGNEGEQYEQTTIDGIDDVFERFTRRLGSEARQVVRYEYNGTPLPFSAMGPLYKQLWPSGWRGAMDVSSVPPCPHCGAPRVFELQLMPNLANLLRPDKLSDADSVVTSNSEEHRQAEISSLLGLKDTNSDMCTGIVWSTAMVFVCSRDCCSDTEGWAEEWVGVQHEGDL